MKSSNEEKLLKMVKMLEARWLSSERAVNALRLSLASVIKVMTHPKRKKEPGAGCSKLLRSFRFIATLELFADTLPHLSNLSRVFQTRSLDFSAIAAALNVTRAAITVKAELASAVKDHLTAAVAPAAPAPADPLMVKIEEKLAELRNREIEIAYDDARWRRNWAGIRAQWLRALLDQIDHRFPATQLFADFATLFDPVKLPATLAAAIGSGHGDEAIKRLAEILSQVRPALPQLAEQLSIVERTAAEHKKATKSAAKAKAKDADDDEEMLDADGAVAVDGAADGKDAKSSGDGKDAKSSGDSKDSKSSASASSSTKPSPGAYADAPYIDKARLIAEWPNALAHLVDVRDADPVLAALKKDGKFGTQALLRQFVNQPSNQRMFPETIKLANYALSLPVSTAECERCFSLMNIIKTALRNRIGEERLADLMRVALGPELTDKALDWNAMLFIWYRTKDRKVRLNLVQSAEDKPAAPIASALRSFVLADSDLNDVEML